MSGAEWAVVYALFAVPLLRLLVWEALDSAICSFGRRITKNVSDGVMFALNAAVLAIVIGAMVWFLL